MDRHLINYLLRKNESSGAEVGRLAGVSRSAVSRVIAGQRKSPHIRNAVAQAIGVPVEKIWPTTEIKPKKNNKIKGKKQTNGDSIRTV